MLDRLPQELGAALEACRRHVLTAAAFSLALNLLHLAAPLYMMQVYDRVITSGSRTTLAVLTLVVLAAYVALAALDRARASVLAAASLRLDRHLAGPVFAAMLADATRTGNRHAEALRDLDACRHLVSGHAMTALFDLPWLPLYVLIGFLMHWSIGLFTLISAALLVAVAAATELHVRPASRAAVARSSTSLAWAEAALSNSHTVRAMAMLPGLVRRWGRERNDAVVHHHEAGDRTARMTALVRFLRLAMQSLVLGLGAWLVIEHAATAGTIFAGSLLLGRALQPVEQVIAQWQSIIAARAAFERLSGLLSAQHALSAGVRIAAHEPATGHRLVATGVSVMVPGRPAPVLSSISFAIEPGAAVGLIGPSGAGKSTLVRLLVGATGPMRGSITLGGLDIACWGETYGEPAIGYVPQEIELFDDTIAANIGRFGQAADGEIVRAAQIAGAHDMIAALPAGYLTRVGEAGLALSGGMRQRIAIARAVLGRPRLVVLDEPSSNLDKAGDEALGRCLRHLKAQGTTVIVVSHKPATTALVDQFLVLIDGRLHAAGSRQEVVGRLSDAATAPASVYRRQAGSGLRRAGHRHVQ